MRLKGLTGQIANLIIHAQDRNLNQGTVRAFHEDHDGILWVGTYDGGLYRIANGKLTRYTRNDGLYDNGVFQILEDDANFLWMGSNRGIYRVSRHELNEFAEGRRRSITSLAFGSRDGLATPEVNGGRQPAGMKAADGKLWFPTMGGVAILDPASMKVDTTAPPAIIEEIRLAGVPVSFKNELVIPPSTPAF
jgi:sugar lactone lactonase YvrE